MGLTEHSGHGIPTIVKNMVKTFLKLKATILDVLFRLSKK